MKWFKSVGGLLFLMLLLGACGTNSSGTSVPPGGAVAATPVVTPRNGVTLAELNYPAARWLSEKDIWPEGRPSAYQGRLFGAFITDDNRAQILDFYQKKLVGLGFGSEPNYECLDLSQCREIYGLDADLIECVQVRSDGKDCASTYQINFTLISGHARPEDDRNGYIPLTVYRLARPAQSVVTFMAGPYRPFQPPAYPATTAAFVSSPPAPGK